MKISASKSVQIFPVEGLLSSIVWILVKAMLTKKKKIK